VRDSRAYDEDLPAPKMSVKKSLTENNASESSSISCEYEVRKEWYINAF
jgi:hypothetical protein